MAGAVVALREGVFRLEFASGGALTQLAPPPLDPSLHPFNEGACDAAGRFWIGVMFDPLHPEAQQQTPAQQQKSSLHGFTLKAGLRREPDAAELHNGMAWSPDGHQFYLFHNQSREILPMS
jgi:sugar lactone lactonase YvrE